MGYCLLAYVVLVHLSIVLRQPPLAGAALVVLIATFIYPPLKARRPWAWLALFGAAALSAWTVRQGVTLYALYLPPVVLPLAMLFWWGGSLRAGQTPLVTRIATRIRGPLTPEFTVYTRRVTQLWVGVFALLAVEAAALALWAPAEIWSLFANALNNVFMGLVFAAEYLYGRWRFPHLPHPDFVSFIRQISRVNPRRPA